MLEAKHQTDIAEERARQALEQKVKADAATEEAEKQKRLADERLADVEKKQEELIDEKKKTDDALAQATSESEKARQAKRQAETSLVKAKAAETRALAISREATILRLAAEGPAITRGSWAGGSLRGLLTVLVAHRLSDPGNPRTSAATFGALQGEDLRLASLQYLREQSSGVRCATFSPDGRRIVSGSDDNTLRLWDAATGAAIGEPLKGHSGSVTSVAFSPDGRRIASGSGDSTLRVWPVLESWADALCAKLPRNMSRKEWKSWVGDDIAYTCQCPGLPVPPDDDPLSPTPAALCATPYQPQPVASRRSP